MRAAAVLARSVRGVWVHKEDTMSGTNPGTWPDDWHGDVDDGKRKAFAELDKTIPLYTAAEMKAAMIKAVERCLKVVKNELLSSPDDCETDISYDHGVNRGVWAIEKLKEEIENEG